MAQTLVRAAADLLMRLEDGWELAQGTTYFGHGKYWIQKDGLGNGGPSLNVHGQAVATLQRQGRLKYTWGFPHATLTLRPAREQEAAP